jgi:preprotein translocase subunit SecF
MKYRFLYFAFSLLIIVPGLVSLATYGLKLSIEFTGGSVLRLEGLASSGPKVISENKTISQAEVDAIVTDLKKDNPDVKIASFETLGPTLGQETIKKTLYAVLLASVLLLVHISRAFKQLKYGVCAILAMLHDSLVLLGSFSLLGHFFGVQTDLLFVTAALTVLSFSVHDTIVVYDRIRELQKRQSNLATYDTANQAVSETMIRSLNNSLTIIFMLLALFLLGGETTKYFALALLIGTISGSYSSPFTAVPLLVTWDSLRSRKK